MKRLRRWTEQLHAGQLIMLLAALITVAVVALSLASEFARSADWQAYLIDESTDYSQYHSSGDHLLEDADLWERKASLWGSDNIALIYVAFRPGGSPPDRLRDSATVVLTGWQNEVDRDRSAMWSLLAVAALASGVAFWSLWTWFGGRRKRAGTSQDGFKAPESTPQETGRVV